MYLYRSATDGSFSTPSDTHVPTAQAVYDFVQSVVTSGMVMPYIAYTNSANTFSLGNTFLSTTHVNDLEINSSNNLVWGDIDTDNSYKMAINGDGDLELGQRLSGSWQTVMVLSGYPTSSASTDRITNEDNAYEYLAAF